VQHFLQSALKVSKKSKRLQRNNKLPLFLVFLGLIIFSFGAINYYRVRILSFSKVPEAAASSTRNVDIPVEIIIPSIQIDLKVEPGQIKNGVWLVSDSTATFLNTSAAPGSGGNTVIYGHNLKKIFANLPYLSIGQKIIVKTESGKIYNYIADEKYFVGPDRVDLVSPTKSEQLTIYTCWGIFDSERAVVIAKPI
jgi:LPXTG-site transpeptidase (sortase) family protein